LTNCLFGQATIVKFGDLVITHKSFCNFFWCNATGKELLKFLLDCHHFHTDLGCLLLTADLCNKGAAANHWDWHLDLGYMFLAARLLEHLGYDAVLAWKLCMNQYAVLCTSISVTKGAGCCQNSTVQTYLPIKLSV